MTTQHQTPEGLLLTVYRALPPADKAVLLQAVRRYIEQREAARIG